MSEDRTRDALLDLQRCLQRIEKDYSLTTRQTLAILKQMATLLSLTRETK